MANGFAGPDPKQSIMSLFASIARTKAQMRLAERQPKNTGYSDQQKAQINYLENVIGDERSSPEEVSMAQKKLQGLLGLDFGEGGLDYSQEIGAGRQDEETKRQQGIEKFNAELENLKRTGKLREAQTGAAKALEYQRYKKANEPDGGGDSGDVKDYLNQIDKSIDNARMLLRKKPNIEGRMVIDYDDPQNQEILRKINTLENKRIEAINQLKPNNKNQNGNNKSNIKKTIPWK